MERPRPVEELYRYSSNERLREFAMRITRMKAEAEHCLLGGLQKTALTVACLGGTLAAIWYSTAFNEPLEKSILIGLSVVGGVLSGKFFTEISDDLTAVSLARGEVQALTTVLASHAIAESTKPSK